MHDEPFWRSSEEVKRVALYQREFRTGPGLHNLSAFRIDSFRRVDHVFLRSAYGCELNSVAYHYPFQFAEETCPGALRSPHCRPRQAMGFLVHARLPRQQNGYFVRTR
jgi:hypothetical protein